VLGLVTYLVHRKLKGNAPEDPHMHKKVKINKNYSFSKENISKKAMFLMILFFVFTGSW
jgi:hypothetical protein